MSAQKTVLKNMGVSVLGGPPMASVLLLVSGSPISPF